MRDYLPGVLSRLGCSFCLRVELDEAVDAPFDPVVDCAQLVLLPSALFLEGGTLFLFHVLYELRMFGSISKHTEWGQCK